MRLETRPYEIMIAVIVASAQMRREILVLAINLQTLPVTLNACLFIVIMIMLHVMVPFATMAKPAL